MKTKSTSLKQILATALVTELSIPTVLVFEAFFTNKKTHDFHSFTESRNYCSVHAFTINSKTLYIKYNLSVVLNYTKDHITKAWSYLIVL